MKTLRILLLSLPFFIGSLAANVTLAAETVEVRIAKMEFDPVEIKVKAGDTVKWVSYEKRGYHTVWFKDEGLPESSPLFIDDSTTRQFEKPGRYPYECGPHPQMKGVVIVE